MQKGINVRPGVKTHVSIKREFFNKLEEPYSDCLNDLNSPPNEYAKSLFNFFINMNVNEYNFEFCALVCFQDKLKTRCNCTDITTPKLKNESYCLTDIELSCMQNFTSYFKSVNTYKFCGKACPEKCYSVNYILKAVSKENFKDINYLKKLQTLKNQFFPQLEPGRSITGQASLENNITDQNLLKFVNEGYLKLSINYDSLYYTVINEKAQITSDDVWNFFGQQIGIYLDASVLTCCEFPVFLISLVFNICIYIRSSFKVES